MRYLGRTILMAGLLCSGIAAGAVGDVPSGRELMHRLRAAVAKDELPALADELEDVLRNTMADHEDAKRRGDRDATGIAASDMQAMLRAVVVYRIADHFGAIRRPNRMQKPTLGWLVNQPQLLTALATAVTEHDRPANVLRVLRRLPTEQADQINEQAQLVAALCVVWDDAASWRDDKGSEVGKAELLKNVPVMYRYFVQTNSQRRGRIAQLPWELLVHVVDVQVDKSEMAWAWEHYARRGNLIDLYLEVPLDQQLLKTGPADPIARVGLPLAQARRQGGTCRDQAHFASQVAKANVAPAVVCTSDDAFGRSGHSWIGYLTHGDSRGRVWDFDRARHVAHRGWSGMVRDPQTGKDISQDNVSILGPLAHVPAEQRMRSRLLHLLCAVAPRRMQVELCMEAIDLSPGNRAAWLHLMDMGRDGDLTVDELDEVTALIRRHVREPHAGFICNVFMHVISTRSAEQQLDALNKAMGWFVLRPDLAGRVRIRQGDLLASMTRFDAAFKVYERVATASLDHQPTNVLALDRLDELCRLRRNKQALADVYYDAWRRMAPPKRHLPYVTGTPWYCIGLRYLALLDELVGDRAVADVRTHRRQAAHVRRAMWLDPGYRPDRVAGGVTSGSGMPSGFKQPMQIRHPATRQPQRHDR